MEFKQNLLKQYLNYSGQIVRLFDIAFSYLSAVIAYYFLQYTNFIITTPLPAQVPNYYHIAFIIGALLTVIVFPLFGIYRMWRSTRLLDELGAISLAWLTVFVILFVIAVSTKSNIFFSRSWMVFWFVFGWGLLVFVHTVMRSIFRLRCLKNTNTKNVVVVGAGDLGRHLAKRLKECQWAGLTVNAFFDDAEHLQGQIVEDVMVKGNLDEIDPYVEQHKIDQVWIVLPLRAEKRMKTLLHSLRLSTVEIKMVPDIFGLQLLNHSLTDIAGIPVINISATPIVGANRMIKVLEDFLLALIILVLISPLMLIIAIGVKLSSPGPVFYRQERMSWNGKLFKMLKFRSMPMDAESSSGAVWASKEENRATPFGAFLRKTSLDELPQFINVLKRDMSIVGPRPERPIFVDKFKNEIPGYMQKHKVNAGITGWAQINGLRGSSDLLKRIEYDLYYIENWSLWFDIKIILLTVVKGFVNKNAY